MKTVLTYTFFLLPYVSAYSQTVVTTYSTMIKSDHNIGLTNPVYDQDSPMSYNNDAEVINEKGAAYSINYTNADGGTDFDGYPSGAIGGYKVSGKYYPGVYSACGMPIQIKDLKDNLRIKWKPFQKEAHDSDDKWWATINVIFDIDDANVEPQDSNRNFDIVIEFQRYKQDELADKPKGDVGSYYWFARDEDSNPIPFTLVINEIEYKWGVRYKFFTYPEGDPNESKNDKVHVKFIPLDNNNIPLELDHSLKVFIDASKSFLEYVDLPDEEALLVEEKLANPDLWIKTISAGHEVYSGNSTLGQEHFYTVVDDTPPNPPTKLSAIQYQEDGVMLDWEAYTEDSYESYSVYRANDNGEFSLLASKIYTNSFIDETPAEGILYKYYVTVSDRSFNESSRSNEVSIELSLAVANHDFSKFNLYPNPASSTLLLSGNFAKSAEIIIYSLDGKQVKEKEIAKDSKEIQLDISDLDKGMFIVSVDGDKHALIIE